MLSNILESYSVNTYPFSLPRGQRVIISNDKDCVGLSSAVFKICGQQSVNVSDNPRSEVHCMQSVNCSLQSAVCSLQTANCSLQMPDTARTRLVLKLGSLLLCSVVFTTERTTEVIELSKIFVILKCPNFVGSISAAFSSPAYVPPQEDRCWSLSLFVDFVRYLLFWYHMIQIHRFSCISLLTTFCVLDMPLWFRSGKKMSC